MPVLEDGRLDREEALGWLAFYCGGQGAIRAEEILKREQRASDV
jgi:hypothetical protein